MTKKISDPSQKRSKTILVRVNDKEESDIKAHCTSKSFKVSTRARDLLLHDSKGNIEVKSDAK